MENCERITQTLRNELNPKPSGTIVDSKFTQDEYFMTRDLRDAYRDPTLRSPMTPGISPMVARYRSASVEAMIAIENTIRKVQYSKQERYSPEEVEKLLLESIDTKTSNKNIVPYYELTYAELEMDRSVHNVFVDSIGGPLESTAKQVAFSETAPGIKHNEVPTDTLPREELTRTYNVHANPIVNDDNEGSTSDQLPLEELPRTYNVHANPIANIDYKDSVCTSFIDYNDTLSATSIEYEYTLSCISIDSNDSVGMDPIDYDDFVGEETGYGDTVDGILLSDINDLSDSHYYMTGSRKYELVELPPIPPYEVHTYKWKSEELAPWPHAITPDPQLKFLEKFVRKHYINFVDVGLNHTQLQEATNPEFPKIECQWESRALGEQISNSDVTLSGIDEEETQLETKPAPLTLEDEESGTLAAIYKNPDQQNKYAARAAGADSPPALPIHTGTTRFDHREVDVIMTDDTRSIFVTSVDLLLCDPKIVTAATTTLEALCLGMQLETDSQNFLIDLKPGSPGYQRAIKEAIDCRVYDEASPRTAESYYATNATMNWLYLSYMLDDMGLTMPLPIQLQIDDAAAQAFAGSTLIRTEVKYINHRQHWVRTLRDKNIYLPVHVDTKENLADFFITPQDKSTFWYLMAKIMLITTQAAEEANTSE